MVETSMESPARAVPTTVSHGATRDVSSYTSAAITAATIGAYVALLVVASRWGESLLAHGTRLQVETPPLVGVLDWRPGRTAIPAIVVAVAAIAIFTRLSDRWRWPTLLVATAVGALAWAIALALIDGPEELTQPLLSHQYLHTVAQIDNLGTFLRTFTHQISHYNIHTQGHPPGLIVVLWIMNRIGLGGVRSNAALVFAGGAAAVVAVLVATRNVAGEHIARRAVPFLVLAPAAVAWTSGDPFYAGVGAWAVTCLVLATSRRGRQSDGLAVLGGLLFAATINLSYGLALLAIIPVIVAVWRRQYRVVWIAAATLMVAVMLVWVGTGFAWWDGLAATRHQYFAGVANRRPYDYFLVGNLATFAIVIGPAIVVALTRLRRGPFAVLVGAAVAVVLVADISGMSKAEVERIWLPFVPWVMVAGALLTTRVRSARVWLALQAGGALVFAVAIRSPW